MIICGQAFSDEIIAQIDALIRSDPGRSRRGLSRAVCERLGWRSANGKLKEMSCRKALGKLDRLGRIELPAVRGDWGFDRSRAEPQAILEPVASLHCSVGELGEVEVVAVGSRHSRASRDWKGLMERYHYLSAGPLCGAQMRYLIRSKRHGLLGGLSFSAAAWRVSARDRYIGWREDAREANLQQVVCHSRFLIVPQVKVPHLASHVLSLSLKRLVGDWRERYGYEPVLVETFVETRRFRGTCYRAANWVNVGVTVGRGRQDRQKRCERGEKAVYLYGLCGDWQRRLCRTPAGGVVIEAPADQGPQPTDWAEEEFGAAPLGDKRLSTRLLSLARSFYSNPGALIPEACEGAAASKAAYRFFENRRTTMQKVLESHYEATSERVGRESVVLAVQDTTSLNYTTHVMTEGLGLINTAESGAVGLELHDTMAFTPAGTPLGLLDVQCWARDPQQVRNKNLLKELPIEKKESAKWLHSYRAVVEVQKNCPQTRLVSVGDREADIYELFAEALQDPHGPGLLVRSEKSRQRKAEGIDLWETMGAKEVGALLTVEVPRAGSRKARSARVEVRFAQVALSPLKNKSQMAPVAVWAVYARETNCPKAATALEWMLLTTVETATVEEAIERIQWYVKRWGIEVYHRTLKSGGRIEDRQLAAADRLESCLAIDMVVAWRIYHLTKLSREHPELPCTSYFEEDQWKALVCFVNKTANPPEQPPTLREAHRMVAKLGGFLGRKGDGEPGTQTTWRGLQRLDDFTLAWRILSPNASVRLHTVYEHGYG